MTEMSQDRLYAALVARDPAFEARAFVCVRTTGIFCRLTCPAPKPKKENTSFRETAAECLRAGFRPCKRCRPLASAAEPEPLVAELLGMLEADPARRWSEADLKALGHDPSTVRRGFRRAFGATFLEIARLGRIRAGVEEKRRGGSVIEAQVAAGFESASGFRAALAKLLGRPPSSLDADTALKADFFDTPLGAMIGIADSEGVWLLEFADRRELPAELKTVEAEAGGPVGLGENPVLAALRGQLDAYFEGERLSFDLPLRRGGTPFRRDAWDELRRIPPGTTRSYGEMARRMGRPTGARAVAQANASNRLALIIPCHRVIAADGQVAGYAGGVWRKRWLLEHERRAVELASSVETAATAP